MLASAVGEGCLPHFGTHLYMRRAHPFLLTAGMHMEKKTGFEQPPDTLHAPPQGPSPLSIHRAFVVQFRLETNLEKEEGKEEGPVTGRVEHVASGQASFFDSFEELAAFFGHILSQHKGAPALKPDEPKPE